MKKTDDYELYDKDFDEFVRRGLEAFGLDHPGARKLDMGRDEGAETLL